MSERARHALREGTIAGSIGYAVVVVFYGLLNVAAGRSVFHSAAALGHALLGTLPASGAVEPAAAPVLVYNGLHLVVFLGLGMALAWLALELERHPKIWYLVLGVGMLLFFHLVAGLWALTYRISEAVPLWSVPVASALAGLAMGGYLWAVHPRLRRELGADLEDPGG